MRFFDECTRVPSPVVMTAPRTVSIDTIASQGWDFPPVPQRTYPTDVWNRPPYDRRLDGKKGGGGHIYDGSRGRGGRRPNSRVGDPRKPIQPVVTHQGSTRTV